jgi:hypothetical protein
MTESAAAVLYEASDGVAGGATTANAVGSDRASFVTGPICLLSSG